MELFALSGVAGGMLGILFASYVSFGWSGFATCMLIGAVLSLLYAWKRQVPYLLASVFVIVFGIGLLRMSFVSTTLPASFVALLNQKVELEGKIVADPDLRETTQRVTIEVETNGQTTKVLVIAPLYPQLSYGETVAVQGMLERPEPFASDGGRTFMYDRFLAKDGVFAIVQRASITAISERTLLDKIIGSLYDVKRVGVESLAKALPEPHASLASGLILGGKQGLGEELLDDFIRSGLVHIVVLSGYNVMIVAEFVLRFFGFLPRRKAAVIAGATIGVFVLIAGAGAASIRAGIMAGIALFARATGRTYDAFRALILAGAVMVLVSPLSLLYDPGFQLSFVATLGLIFFAPLVEARLLFIHYDFLREIVAATIAAQVAVLPLLLYQNGLFSVISLPANILVLPLVPLAMLASFLAGVAGLLIPSIAPVFGLPAYILLSYIVGVVEISSGLPLAAFSVPAFPLGITIAAYAAIVIAVYKKAVTSLIQARASR